jgi:hypothetical protein
MKELKGLQSNTVFIVPNVLKSMLVFWVDDQLYNQMSSED